MGLDISNSKNSERVGSYSALHEIRYMAYLYCGGDEIGHDTFVELERTLRSHAVIDALEQFPNLMLHSDCDGSYTRNGKTPDANSLAMVDYYSGNSVALLAELNKLREFFIKKNLSFCHNYGSFEPLYKIVKQAVEELDGEVKFC